MQTRICRTLQILTFRRCDEPTSSFVEAMRVVDLCPECRIRVRAYQREIYATTQLRRGAVARFYTPSARAARRVIELLDAGETYSSIGEKADIPRSSLCRIVTAYRRREPSTMRSDVAARILGL